MDKTINKLLLSELYHIITAEKQEKFNRIAQDRTRYLTVVVENIFQDHNASAVMRSCDCFGIQDLHIIERGNRFTINKDIAMGAGRWIDHHHYNDIKQPTQKCLQELKEKGYKIVATSPHEPDKTIFNLDLSTPIALVFGTEQSGLSEMALSLADESVNIPMYGFTESFNISVSAALSMQALRNRLEKEHTPNTWKLNDEEQIALKIEWCKRILKNGDNVVADITKRIKEGKGLFSK